MGITLKEFNAIKKEQTSFISWVTADDLNNDYFIIERSTDGVNFTPISSQIHSQGIDVAYHFIDKHPYNGYNYYRLVQYDRDANVSKSEAITVDFSMKEPLSIFPNPASDLVQVEIEATRSSTILIEITDVTGRTVQ